MRKSSIAVLLSVGMLCGAWLLKPPPAIAQSDSGVGLQRFSGTAWVILESAGFPPIPAILTAHPDGTFMIVDGTDEGLGGLASVNSAAIGAYKQSGSHQTTNRSIYLSYVDSIPVAAFVNDSVSNWNNTYTGGSGVLHQRRYDLLAGENPLDPTQGTPFGNPVTYTFWLLQP